MHISTSLTEVKSTLRIVEGIQLSSTSKMTQGFPCFKEKGMINDMPLLFAVIVPVLLLIKKGQN